VRRFLPDPYIVAILGTVLLASVLPARGPAVSPIAVATKLAIALLFFLHGAKLSREAIVAGATHWRLHLLVLGTTFCLFPLLGLALRGLPGAVLAPSLATGVLFLCCLPSTVQSSIAFTSVARGNVAAAICAASASNLLCIFVTPLLAAITLGARGSGGSSVHAIGDVALQLLLPFAAGQAARVVIREWIGRHGRLVGFVDRGSILLVVYGAFSAAVVEGLWSRVTLGQIAALAIVCALLLAAVLTITTFGARRLHFSKADEITIVFCGSKKSLASGVPMASILFPAPQVGVMVLPLMLFHQFQLMACALLAQRYAARGQGSV